MRVVCPGSYDPLTAGHVDVVRRASALFDEVIVAVVHNPAKTGTFPIAERIAFIQNALEVHELPNVTIDDVPGGLLVDYCASVGAPAVVKGLRGGTDFAYELPMALMNRHLTRLETIFLAGDPQLEHVSSSLVKEVVKNGGDITGLVPDDVNAALRQKFGLSG